MLRAVRHAPGAGIIREWLGGRPTISSWSGCLLKSPPTVPATCSWPTCWRNVSGLAHFKAGSAPHSDVAAHALALPVPARMAKPLWRRAHSPDGVAWPSLSPPGVLSCRARRGFAHNGPHVGQALVFHMAENTHIHFSRRRGAGAPLTAPLHNLGTYIHTHTHMTHLPSSTLRDGGGSGRTAKPQQLCSAGGHC